MRPYDDITEYDEPWEFQKLKTDISEIVQKNKIINLLIIPIRYLRCTVQIKFRMIKFEFYFL
jgi:hypothetical protein